MLVFHLSLVVMLVGIMSGDSFRSFMLPRFERLSPTSRFDQKSTARKMCMMDDDDGVDEMHDEQDYSEFNFPSHEQSIYTPTSVKNVEVRE